MVYHIILKLGNTYELFSSRNADTGPYLFLVLAL